MGRLHKKDWWHTIGKIEKRIEGWKAKLLSQGGRLVLVNSVLSNLALYYLSIFKAPKWAIRRIEVLRRAFFWKGGSAVAGGTMPCQLEDRLQEQKGRRSRGLRPGEYKHCAISKMVVEIPLEQGQSLGPTSRCLILHTEETVPGRGFF